MATVTMLGFDVVAFAKFGPEMQLSTMSIYLENLSDHFDVVLSVV